MKVAGSTAVVIGGGSGIGRGTSLGLAAAGGRVVVADIDLSTAEAVCEEIVSGGGTATAQQIDATDRDSLSALFAAAELQHGGVDIVSSNLGVIVTRPLAEATEADWSWVIELNLMGHVRAVDVALPYLRRSTHGGHIVLTASMAALLGTAAQNVTIGLYTATKHAVLGYGEALRAELAGEGIGVSVLCPGMVQSNLSATSARHRPERHGGRFELPDMTGRQMPAMMPNEDVGPIVVRAIEANRLHILTHPEVRNALQRRHDVLMSDLDFLDETSNG